ncbi:MAG: hypothetical protein IPP34_11710 [Bacteroidetes bacterium]|nr:hypothetical protein [Bacteroidota bacterium]
MKTEKVLIVLAIIGICFKFLHWEGGGLILILSLMALSVIYFPGGFYFFSDKSVKRQNIPLSIISGFFLAIAPVGVLFKFQYWEGKTVMLLVSVISSIIIFSIALILKSKATDELKVYYKNMLLRTAIITVVTIMVSLVPSETLIKIQYSDDPELARLKTLHYLNPDNEEYRKAHDEYILEHESK